MQTTKQKMKDSGIEWIGKIPQDWSIQKLKHFCNFQSGDGFPEELQGQGDGEIPFYKVSDINGEEKVVSVSANYVTQLLVKENGWHLIQSSSILMAKIGAALAKNHRKIATQPCCIDNNMLAVSAKKTVIDAAYLYWLLKNLDLADFQNISSVPSVNMGWLKECSYPVPPKSIQTIFTGLLNHKTTAIDHTIEQKRKLIDLLKEKRTAIINRAVTRGLDENVELVDSGVEWIGKVPKGWRVERLKSVANINRDVLSEDTPADHVINYLDIGDVESNGAVSVPTEYTFENAPSRARRLVHNGTVILATVRTYLKAISYIENPADNLIVSTGFATLDASKKILSKYLYYLASSELIIQNVVRYSTGVSYPAIAPTVLGGLPVIYPSIKIQKQIVAHLDESLGAIDLAIEKIQTSIRLLNEYRTSLISHVVTGKVEIYDRV